MEGTGIVQSGGAVVRTVLDRRLFLGLLALTAAGSLVVGGSAAAGAKRSIAFAGCAREAGGHPRRWRPAPTTEPWQWQLQGKVDTTIPACVYDVDGFEAPKRVVALLHRKGAEVICYLDVGSWESYRPDRDEFPRSVIGRRYQGFPDERWLDVAHFRRFERPLKQRFSMCARKGFDAVEPDNLAGWEPENHTGFRITRVDQLRFNRWVARQVHGRGMSVALKNDGRQAGELAHSFDFAIVEQCFQYDECGYYRTFVQQGKAVFEAEYEEQPVQYCRAALALRFSALRKSYDLFARPWRPCGQASLR